PARTARAAAAAGALLLLGVPLALLRGVGGRGPLGLRNGGLRLRLLGGAVARLLAPGAGGAGLGGGLLGRRGRFCGLLGVLAGPTAPLLGLFGLGFRYRGNLGVGVGCRGFVTHGVSPSKSRR